ncbi:hypothetical protein [Curtobacterium sp. MCSS17_016]|uniref:hypothetical protein n=1 Tax=Curtobacterium sp. MCSS17_016 TaxID=2175644 RepID=UPI0011B49AD8|nr:hypothetical protein [Curtobacterium sp. MCSS17_016]WIE79080.1 hypothetical protein DEJ19_000535 [Curtobacterium sp. MCSS17_016]
MTASIRATANVMQMGAASRHWSWTPRTCFSINPHAASADIEEQHHLTLFRESNRCLHHRPRRQLQHLRLRFRFAARMSRPCREVCTAAVVEADRVVRFNDRGKPGDLEDGEGVGEIVVSPSPDGIVISGRPA